jgi:hypothetical protein
MRRILLTVAGMTALALAIPGAALADSHHHHHFKHHAHHARANRARVSFRHLGPAAANGPGPSSTTPSSGSTTTPTPKPATTPTTTEEDAGTVESYASGVLTLKLNNNSTVSGNVTINTSFKCLSSTTTSQPTGNTPSPGGDNGWGNGQGWGNQNPQGGPPWKNGQGPQGQWQQGGGDENGPGGDWNETPVSTEPPCDSGALTKGTTVRAAELRIAPGGTEFVWITLVR